MVTFCRSICRNTFCASIKVTQYCDSSAGRLKSCRESSPTKRPNLNDWYWGQSFAPSKPEAEMHATQPSRAHLDSLGMLYICTVCNQSLLSSRAAMLARCRVGPVLCLAAPLS